MTTGCNLNQIINIDNNCFSFLFKKNKNDTPANVNGCKMCTKRLSETFHSNLLLDNINIMKTNEKLRKIACPLLICI